MSIVGCASTHTHTNGLCTMRTHTCTYIYTCVSLSMDGKCAHTQVVGSDGHAGLGAADDHVAQALAHVLFIGYWGGFGLVEMWMRTYACINEIQTKSMWFCL